MTSETEPLTKLDAVNLMLIAVNKQMATSLDTPLYSIDRDQAVKALIDTSREVQSDGWWFNEEFDVELAYSPSTGHVSIPLNTASLRLVGISRYKRLVQRGTKLYDRVNHTFNIGEAVHADIVFVLDFEDLPQAAKWYITVKAARRFAVGKVPSMEEFRFTKVDEDEARVKFEQEDADDSASSMKYTSPHIARMRKR